MRHIHYQGEAHPALAKRAIVVSVDSLPLKTPEAIHKFKLVAGARWTPNPPKDGGLCEHEPWGNGFFKISCDTFQNSEMNLKWASDALDRLVAEANVRTIWFTSRSEYSNDICFIERGRHVL